MKKFLVICVSSEACVCSIDPFDTEEEANLFISTDAASVYSEYEGEDSSSIECYDGFAAVTTDDMSWKWTTYPMDI